MNIKEIIKGIIIGIAKIIPGLSGAVLMISFNLYDRALEAITNFFENPKKNFIFLFNLGLGIILGIVFFSKIIHYFLTKYYLYTTMLFIGLILGGIPIINTKIQKNISNTCLSLIAFLLMSLLAFGNSNYVYTLKNNSFDLLVFFLSGILEAIGTVLPGISSTALLMLIGVYDYYITVLGNALTFAYLKQTLAFVLPFSMGMFIGIISVSLLVNYLFKYFKSQTFAVILGISLSSVFLLLIKLLPCLTTIPTVVISAILFTLGFYITSKL